MLTGNLLGKSALNGELQKETTFIRDFEYPDLLYKPKINNVELVGNKTLEELGITSPKKTSELQNDGDGTSPFATEDYVKTNGGKIDKILVNNQEQTINNKTVNIPVPTKTSQLQNDGDGSRLYATERYVENAVYGLATTNYVDTKVAGLVNSAPETLDTLGELATAFNENKDVVDALNEAIVNKADKSEIPTKTSNLENDGNGTSPFATESYVDDAILEALSDATSFTEKRVLDLEEKVDTKYVKNTQIASKDIHGIIKAWEEDDYLCLETVIVPELSRTFSENTPEGIAYVSSEISAQNMTSAQVAEVYGWNLGDAIPITLSTGEVIQMQIIGFNHDDLSDGSGKAGLTLQMVDCLATLYKASEQTTNAGGYAASMMKQTTLPTIKNLLPKEWQDAIKLVNKKSANGGKGNYSQTLTLSEDLFLLSMIEVDGSSSYAQDYSNEGSVYEYWSGKSDQDKIKKHDADGDGEPDTAIRWWLRSSSSMNDSHFCVVKNDGATNVWIVYYSVGVSFAFCI